MTIVDVDADGVSSHVVCQSVCTAPSMRRAEISPTFGNVCRAVESVGSFYE